LTLVKGFGTKTTTIPRASCCVVAGPESFFRRRAITAIVHEHVGATDAATAVETCDAARVSPGEIFNDVQSPSLFARERVVVVENATAILREQTENILAHAEQVDHAVRLVLDTDQGVKRLRLDRRLTQKAAVIECYGLLAGSVGQFLSAEARHLKKKIGPRAVQLLGARIGPDASALAGEMEKLAVYVGAKESIAAEDVEALVGGYRDFDTFELARCVVRRDSEGAFRAAKKLCDEGAVFVVIVGALSRELERVMRMSLLLASGEPTRDAAQAAGVPWWEADAAAKVARSVGQEKLEDVFCLVAEADVAVKRGLVSESTALDELIARATRSPASG